MYRLIFCLILSVNTLYAFCECSSFTNTICIRNDKFINKALESNNHIILSKDSLDNNTFAFSDSLSEITIKGVRRAISYDRDRLVYNVQQTPWSKGFTAMDVVTKMPWADPTKRDDDAISLLGKDGVIVLINDRKINLQGKQLASYLNNIKSENIIKVEVMTNPSPEFSAEGNMGVINIVTNQKRNVGFEGNIRTEYMQHRKSTFTESADINFSNKLIEIDYNIYNDNENNYSKANRDYEYNAFTRMTDQTTTMKYNGLSQNLNLNIFLNDKMNLGLIGTYDYTKDSSNNGSRINYTDFKYENIEETTQMKGNCYYFSITPYYEWNIDSLGKKFSVSYTFIHNKGKECQNYMSSSTILFNKSELNDVSRYNCINLDLKLPYTWMNFETGGEYKIYNVDNQSEYSVVDKFLYKEKVLSLYADLNREFGKWYAKVGTRYEYSWQRGTSNISTKEFILKYGKFFPFVDIIYHPTDEQSIVFGYSKRIERPAMYYLKPIRTYSDSYNYWIGNPELSPTMMDYIELKYMYNNLYLGFSYVYSKDAISCIFQDFDGVMQAYYTNGLNINSLGMDANYTLNLHKLSLNLGGSLSYNASSPILSQICNKDLKGVISRLSCDFVYKFRDNLTAYTEYFYVFPGLSKETHIESYQSLSFGANLRLIKDKLTIGVGVRDIFNTNKSKNKIYYSNYTFYSKFDNDIRNFYIKLSYRFGNDKVHHCYIDVNPSDNRISSAK